MNNKFMENNKTIFDWENTELYTKEFKEWIWKLFRKVHARIGHVEEKLALLEPIKINGEEPVGERSNNEFVSVSVTKEMENVNLKSEVQLAEKVEDASLPDGYIHAESTGLASDGYVKDYIEAVFKWEIVNV